MRHIIRLNVAGEGYSLLAGDSGALSPQPLETISVYVPKSYLSVQGRLDDFFAKGGGPWSMSFQSGESNGCILGYGCRLGASDQWGRSGLVFVHALILESPHELPAFTMAVISLLSPTGVEEFAKGIGDVAQGRAQAPDFVNWLTRKLETRARALRGIRSIPGTGPVLGEIVHDCAGGAAIAWWCLAVQQAHAMAPWEVFDLLGTNRQPSTKLNPSSGETRQASALLMGLAAMVSREDSCPPQRKDPDLALVSVGRETGSEGRRASERGRQELAPRNDPGKRLDSTRETVTRPPAWLTRKTFVAMLGCALLSAVATGMLVTKDVRAQLRRSGELLEQLERESERSVSATREAEERAADRIAEATKDATERMAKLLEQPLHVSVLSSPPRKDDCDERVEEGGVIVYRGRDGAWLYICSQYTTGWDVIGEPSTARASKQLASGKGAP